MARKKRIPIDKNPFTDYNMLKSPFRDSCAALRRILMVVKDYIELIEQQNKERDSIYHNVALKYGLSDTAMWILYNVCASDEAVTQQELCRQCFFAKQTVNTTITSLIKNELVTLEVIPGTRNKKKILLTESGKVLIEEKIMPLIEAEICAYSVLSENELKTYLEMSSRLTTALREETEKL